MSEPSVKVSQINYSVVDLWQETFGGSTAEIFEAVDDLDSATLFSVSEDDKVISMIIGISVQYKNLHGLYLYAVATDREHRGQGLMLSCLKTACLWAYDKCYDFVMLIPKDERLDRTYEKYGFTSKVPLLSAVEPITEDDAYVTLKTDVDARDFDGDYDILYSLSGMNMYPSTLKYALSTYGGRLRLTEDSYILSHKDNPNRILDTSLPRNMLNIESKWHARVMKFSDFDIKTLYYPDPLPR